MRVTARVTRTQNWWAIEVPEFPGVFTQAKRLDQVAVMVADAVALMEDVNAESVEVTIEPVLPGSVAEHLHEAKSLLKQAARLQADASAMTRELVAELRDEQSLTVRDVGVLLGVSPQRVSQLTATDRTNSGRSALVKPAASGRR